MCSSDLTMAEDLARRDRADRNEGANLIASVDENGQVVKRKGRHYESGSTPIRDGERTLFDSAGASRTETPFDEAIVEALERAQIIEQAMTGLSERQRHIAFEVMALERSVTEVADEIGLARETVSRELSKATKRMRVNLGVSIAPTATRTKRTDRKSTRLNSSH